MNPEAEAEQITGMVRIRRRSRELKKMFVVPFEGVVKRIFRDDKDTNPKWTGIQLEVAYIFH